MEACLFLRLLLCVPVAAGQDPELRLLQQPWGKQNLAAPALKVSKG